MDGFERRKEQKKEDIRRAALALFQSYGFKKVSIDEIARKAGVSQVTIFRPRAVTIAEGGKLIAGTPALKRALIRI